MTQITRLLSAALVFTLPSATLASAQEPSAATPFSMPPVSVLSMMEAQPPQVGAPGQEPEAEPPAAVDPSQMAASEAWQRGLRAYRNRNFSQAIQEFDIVLEAEPDRADVYYLMGYSHYVLKHFQDSLDAFRLAFELNPELDPRGIYQPQFRTEGQ